MTSSRLVSVLAIAAFAFAPASTAAAAARKALALTQRRPPADPPGTAQIDFEFGRL